MLSPVHAGLFVWHAAASAGGGGTNEPPGGLPATDLDGNPRRMNDPDTPDRGSGDPPIVDMGAYEYATDCNDNGAPDAQDIADGADHLRKLALEHPLDLERVIVMGHSAGGHLALWLAARDRLPDDSPFRSADAVEVDGVLGLAAAADIGYLHEREVCGHVIDGLMGGGPEAFPERYDAGSPVRTVPVDVPQRLVNGARDTFWTPVAERYVAAALQLFASVALMFWYVLRLFLGSRD